ncbi:MAG: flap endonuclease-1 [Candidatus ainarchaeum sp.]|nr:flap endonuclease-1 [Candidatus ainarchaeum sp.]MDD5096318.1 flap endonuclease-1 [Candidatus ainarchaeum sp.]
MGVDLGDLAVKHKVELEELAGKCVAIDGMNILYQFLASIRQEDGMPLMDMKGRVTGHLSGLFYRSIRLVNAGIKPVYVFDGPPPEFKRKTIEGRIEVRREAEHKWKKALAEEKMEEAKRYAQGSSRLTKEMVDESKRLLSLMGIPWVQAPSEGEAQGAYMVREGLCYASASQDYDSLLFGSPIFLRNLSITGKRKVPKQNRYIDIEIELVELEETLKHLGVTREQLILIGIMVGTDFNEGVRGIGPKTGLKIVKEQDTLGKVKAYLKKEKEYEFPEDVEEVYDFFLNAPHKEVGDITWGKPTREGVIELLVDEHDFSLERIDKALEGMIKQVKETRTQRTLDKWF